MVLRALLNSLNVIESGRQHINSVFVGCQIVNDMVGPQDLFL